MMVDAMTTYGADSFVGRLSCIFQGSTDTTFYILAVYSSIVGRFLNYLMVPLYTYTLKSCADYGIYNDIYAQTALLMVILTFGMETTFFRFMNKEEGDKMRVYSTALIMVGSVCLTFAAMVLLFINPIASILDYSNHKWYVGMMFITVAQDAFQAIPFAYLRYKHQPFKFAGLNWLVPPLSRSVSSANSWVSGGDSTKRNARRCCVTHGPCWYWVSQVF